MPYDVCTYTSDEQTDEPELTSSHPHCPMMAFSSRKERNIRLNKALKQLCSDQQAYSDFKRLAQKYVAGQTDARTVRDAFFRLFGEERELFIEMASLLPNSALSNELMATMTTDTRDTTVSIRTPRAVPSSTRPPAATPSPSNPAPPAAEELPIPAWILNDGIPPNSATARPATKGRRSHAAAHDDGHVDNAAHANTDSTNSNTSSKGPNVVVWLRQDLRLHDNPALHHAALLAKKQGGVVVFVFIASVEEDGEPLKSNTGMLCVECIYVGLCVECMYVATYQQP